jgi:hypothetical protein
LRQPLWRAFAVIAGGFALGAAKGAVRVLPGPRHQVSTLGINQAAWTTVPLSQFYLWQARFVREDGLIMFFGLIAATGFISLLQATRAAMRERDEKRIVGFRSGRSR